MRSPTFLSTLIPIRSAVVPGFCPGEAGLRPGKRSPSARHAPQAACESRLPPLLLLNAGWFAFILRQECVRIIGTTLLCMTTNKANHTIGFAAGDKQENRLQPWHNSHHGPGSKQGAIRQKSGGDPRVGWLAPRASAETYDLFCGCGFCLKSAQLLLSLRRGKLKPWHGLLQNRFDTDTVVLAE